MPQEPKETSTPIGDALVKEGVLTREQLERAVRIQQRLEQPKPLGEVLIELGYTTKQAVSETIKKHGSGMRLGDILVEQGLITPDALSQALHIQKDQGIKLGRALIELGAISERVLLQSLAHQAQVPYMEPIFGMIDSTVLGRVSPDYLQRNNFIPFSKNEEGCVTVVVADLQDQACIQAVNELFAGNAQLALGPLDTIQEAIEDFRQFRTKPREEAGEGAVEEEEDSIVQLIDHVISSAIEERASDIHVEPMSDVVRLRYRIDGMLVYRTDLPKDLLPRISSRIKILAECNISENRRHQGGRILYTLNGRDYDLRLSVYVTVHGECIVLRILNKQTGLIDLEELGMNPAMLERFRIEGA